MTNQPRVTSFLKALSSGLGIKSTAYGLRVWRRVCAYALAAARTADHSWRAGYYWPDAWLLRGNDMAQVIGYGTWQWNAHASYFVLRSNKAMILLYRLYLTLCRRDIPLYYTTARSKDAIAQFKVDTIKALNVLWFYETDGYQAAYISKRVSTHVVLLKEE